MKNRIRPVRVHSKAGLEDCRTHSDGPRGSVQAVLNLIDTADPSWPTVAGVLREFTEAGIDLDEATVTVAVKLGTHRAADGLRQRTAVPLTLIGSAPAIVYYIRRGDVIKIGTTVAPHTRFAALLPDEILAVEPGGRQEETRRHRQFRHLRGAGEHFRDAPELRDHISHVRALYGEPDPSWPTSASARRPARAWQLPPPASTESMTAAEAEAQLGIKENTLRGWVHRGRIQASGKDHRRRHLYYRDHLVALRDSARERRGAGF